MNTLRPGTRVCRCDVSPLTVRSEHLGRSEPRCGPTCCRCHIAHLVWSPRRPRPRIGGPRAADHSFGASKTPSPLNAKVAEEASLKPSRYEANIRESAQPPRRRGDHCSLVFRLGLFTEQFEGRPCLRAVQGDTVDLGLFPGFVELQISHAWVCCARRPDDCVPDPTPWCRQQEAKVGVNFFQKTRRVPL